MRAYNIISAVFFMIIGVCVIIGGLRLGFGEWKEPGSGFIPVLSGILIFFLSALWLVITLIKKWSIEPTKIFFSKPGSYKKIILTILAFVIYTFLLNKVGFMISTFIFMTFLFRAIEPKGWRLTIILALIVTILSIFVFQLWLQVQLPEGPFTIYMIKKWIN